MEFQSSGAENPDGEARVYVVAGPTAVGKGTVVQALRREHPDLPLSVSVTTRPPRTGEVNGEHYWFVSDAEFDQMVEADQLLEWAVVHKLHRYGTPREWVETQLAAGRPVLLEVDLDGARQVRERMPDARTIFIAPPSWEELERRLLGRGTEDVEERKRRLQTARTELAAQSEFDVVVINDEVERTAAELAAAMSLD